MEKIENVSIGIFLKNQKKEHECEICEKVFNTKAKLKIHYQNVHANNGEKNLAAIFVPNLSKLKKTYNFI